MNTFVVEKWYDEGECCSFYTVRWADNSHSETDRFFLNHEKATQPYSNEAYELLHLITQCIGNTYGATDDFFDRTENQAQALPPMPKRSVPEILRLGKRFPLRLYCFRISESIVVLFNGGIKSHQTSQGSKDLRLKFYEAQQFALQIIEAIKNGTIVVNNFKREITDFQGNKQIIL